MCGITGFWDVSCGINMDEMIPQITAMMTSIQHRGPDDDGKWLDEHEGIALGFRRLSIIDLSPTGHQPMISANGRYVIIFNGEIYNFHELREELLISGHSFQGRSDTEVMLASISQWGLEKAVQRFNGMFAFALWDRKELRLSLVRDRIGIKPLYYGWVGNVIIFGSELKSLKKYKKFYPEIDREALTLYLKTNYIPTPYSIFKGVFKLQQGTILTIKNFEPGILPEPISYWSMSDVIENSLLHPFEGSEQDAIIQLDALLSASIRERMISDVPLGAFLSGGIDSSTIVAYMQSVSDHPVKTFTIGFDESSYDEARFASKVARSLGTEHTNLVVKPSDALAVIPLLPTLYDEPFSDSSQIPTYLISQLTHRHVTVSLSGDGGDELFGGYNRYIWSKKLWNYSRWMPDLLKSMVSKTLLIPSPTTWDTIFSKKYVPDQWRISEAGEKIRKIAECLPSRDLQSIYRSLVSHWKDPGSIVNGALGLPIIQQQPVSAKVLSDDPIAWMMFMDAITYLPDDILVKLDRASMSTGLEARAPFVDDHRLIEFAWRLPMHFKIRKGSNKWILRQALFQYVPEELFDRPKKGFGIPLDSWLRGPIRPWAEELISKDRLDREGYFESGPIRKKWQQHLNGTHNWQYHLWDILMFQAWLQDQTI